MMSDLNSPEGAPEEVVTKALLREVDLAPFGFSGTLSLISLDNGLDYNRPNTLGPKSLQEIESALTSAEASSSSAIAITGKPLSLRRERIYQLCHLLKTSPRLWQSESLDMIYLNALRVVRNQLSHLPMDSPWVVVLRLAFTATIGRSPQLHSPHYPSASLALYRVGAAPQFFLN